MYNRKVFWTCILFATIGIIIGLTIGGCKPEKPSRLATGIAGGSNGINKAWFCYVTITGDPLEQAGVTMGHWHSACCYMKNDGFGGIRYEKVEPGPQRIKCNGITMQGGQMEVFGVREDWAACPGRWLFNTLSVYSNHTNIAMMGYNTHASAKREVASVDGVVKLFGLNSPPKNKVTGREKSALSMPSTDIPSYGLTAECSVVNIQGNGGEEIAVELNDYMAVDLNPQDYFKYSSPFTMSMTFKTASACSLSGKSFRGTIKTDTCQSGIPTTITVIGDNADGHTHVARTGQFLPVDSSLEISQQETIPVFDRFTAFTEPNIWDTNQYVITVRPDWLSVVDPNLWQDPNTCPDPNVFFDPTDPNMHIFRNRLDTTDDMFDMNQAPNRAVQVPVIPMTNGDYLYVDIDKTDPEFILMIAPHWLSGEKSLDINNDGTVNLLDLN